MAPAADGGPGGSVAAVRTRLGRATRTIALLGVGASLLVTAACGRGGGRADAELHVAVATSLRRAVADAGAVYERRTGVRVDVVDAATPTLLAQLADGAPYDVVAVADATSLTGRADVEPPLRLATNTLVLVTAPGATTGVAELAAPGRRIVMARANVPVGRYARAALPQLDRDPAYAAAVLRNVVSEEANVAAVLARVAAGEADAGFVYRSEVVAASRVRVVPLGALDLDIASTVAVVRRPRRHADAARFAEFLRSPDGVAVLERHGLGAP
jgi:molybdate transport system substrate-binding protein